MALIRDIHPPEEGLVYKNEDTQLKIGEKHLESGTLYITEESLSWKPHSRSEGVSIPWKQISLHGISSNPPKYVYVMLDHKLHWEGVYDPGAPNLNGNSGIGDVGGGSNGTVDEGSSVDGGGGGEPAASRAVPIAVGVGGNQQQNNDAADDSDNDEGNESDCDLDFTEIWLIPSNTNCVDEIFQAMKECQALHPDSADSISDESNFMDAQDIDENDIDDDDDGGNDIGQRGMNNLNLNDEKFADAED